MQIKIQKTDEYVRSNGYCIVCGFSCQASGLEIDDAYELALNHTISTGHKVHFRCDQCKEVTVEITPDEVTIDICPPKKKDQDDFGLDTGFGSFLDGD